MDRLRICVIGEVMVELSRLDLGRSTAQVGVAGDTYNSAVHLARLLGNAGWAIEYVTLLGADSLSDRILDTMQADGVSTALVGRHPALLPGLYAIDLDAQGERSFHYWRGNSAAKRMFSDGYPTFDVLDGATAILFSLISLAILPDEIRAALIAKLAGLRKAGCMIAFDSNYRAALWPDAATARRVCDQAWSVTSLALPSCDDEARLWPGRDGASLLAQLADAGLPEIAMKDGAAGPWLWHLGQRPRAGPFAAADQVVDTSGAGDAFNAGYLAARLQGANPPQAAQQGHALALQVIGHHGAVKRLP